MTDERTDEQRAADAALMEAVRRVVDAYRIASVDAAIITDFLVIGKTYGLIDGEEYRGSFKLYKDGGIGIDWDLLMGMIRRAAIEIEREYFEEIDG